MSTDKNKDLIILPTDPKAARFVENISGWVDINNRFWGLDEKMARYSSSTHSICECGNITSKGWLKCDACREKISIEKYNNMQFKEWVDDCVYSESHNRYFWDSDEIEDFCADEEIEFSDLRLVLCNPNYFHQINGDQWADMLPEDSEELPVELTAAIEELNKVIKNLSPASYSPGKYRTEYKSTAK